MREISDSNVGVNSSGFDAAWGRLIVMNLLGGGSKGGGGIVSLAPLPLERIVLLASIKSFPDGGSGPI